MRRMQKTRLIMQPKHQQKQPNFQLLLISKSVRFDLNMMVLHFPFHGIGSQLFPSLLMHHQQTGTISLVLLQATAVFLQLLPNPNIHRSPETTHRCCYHHHCHHHLLHLHCMLEGSCVCVNDGDLAFSPLVPLSQS